MKRDIAAVLVVAAIATVLTIGAARPAPSVAVAADDYQEECTREGCSGEEVEELYESYKEECLHEGCSKEEVFELGGSAQGVQDMLAHWQRQGRQLNMSDFNNVSPFCGGTTTSCYGVLMFCNDHCVYSDGTESSTYLCGACFGFKW